MLVPQARLDRFTIPKQSRRVSRVAGAAARGRKDTFSLTGPSEARVGRNSRSHLQTRPRLTGWFHIWELGM